MCNVGLYTLLTEGVAWGIWEKCVCVVSRRRLFAPDYGLTTGEAMGISRRNEQL